MVSAPPPLYLNFYCNLAMIAKLSVERLTRTGISIWLRRGIPGDLLMVIDCCNIYMWQDKFGMSMSPRPAILA